MYKNTMWRFAYPLITVTLLGGCGGNTSTPSAEQNTDTDIVFSTRVDDDTGFLNIANISKPTNITSANSQEITSQDGVFIYKNHIYTAQSWGGDKLAKYSYADNTLTKIKELSVGEQSIPTFYIFVSDTKAYVTLSGSGELIVINPTDMSITKRIDLSSYAMGENDSNPEPSGGLIRDGKLYLGLAQLDSYQTFKCRGKASVLIIDSSTDKILKHITDDRTCTTGTAGAAQSFILDENGDIYVNNTASFGYYPDMNSGFLRIKKDEDNFDPDYYFSITDFNDLNVTGGKASYVYKLLYNQNGSVYTTLYIPGLSSSPPDYVNDRNYQPYKLDLYQKTVTKLDLPAGSGYSNQAIKYNGDIIYGLNTYNGTGLYKIGEDTPYITTDSDPVWMLNLN